MPATTRHTINTIECTLPVRTTLPEWRHARAVAKHAARVTHRRHMRHVLATIATAAGLAAGLGYTGTAIAHPTPDAKPCLEDQPCWGWSTMGNHKRGVVTVWGNPLVVGPCTFARLYHTGHISYRNGLVHVPGDRWALVHGCER